MGLFFSGLGLFTLGAILNVAGWEWHRRAVRKKGDGLRKWLVGVLAKEFEILTGRNHTSGERLAAYGAIVSALGIVVAVTGIGVWAAA